MGLYVFGSNSVSQLGLGEDVLVVDNPMVHPFFNGKHIICVAAGGLHSLVYTSDGLFSFGCNDEFALGRDGDESVPGKVEIVGNIVKMCCGNSYSAVLTDKGEVYAWGTFRGPGGVLGFDGVTKFQKVPKKLKVKGIVDLKGGQNHILMMDRKNNVYSYGSGQYGELGYKILRRFKKQGLNVKTAAHSRGKVKAIKDIGCGAFQSFLINRKDEVYGWGKNITGELGTGDKITSHLKRKIDIADVKEINGGEGHTLFLTNKGDLYAAGTNLFGQLGIEQKESEIPAKIDLKNVSEISTFSFSNICRVGNSLYSWGANHYGELGYKPSGNQIVPKKIEFDFGKIKTIASGHDFTLVVTENK
ncbi:Regulator of chromosome condensation [Spraguea lophii 42_110]|uniref:Regulator of chromosome condensation n=1 Tax=Spraguea lophii (strain 42_110) TaxID=1358809 RepID=S7XU72_SPRLO|nr:Regulator of chromosome condensation [Spraguea lophii 42_110]